METGAVSCAGAVLKLLSRHCHLGMEEAFARHAPGEPSIQIIKKK